MLPDNSCVCAFENCCSVKISPFPCMFEFLVISQNLNQEHPEKPIHTTQAEMIISSYWPSLDLAHFFKNILTAICEDNRFTLLLFPS